MINKIYKSGDRFYANDINNVILNVNGNETNIKQIRNTINEDIVKTLVINVPFEDFEKIYSSSKTEDGFPNEYLVNADLGFGMNEINAFIEGKLNVQLMTNLKGVLSEEDFIVTMMLDNVGVQQFPDDNTLLNGERILYTMGLSWINDAFGISFNCTFILSEHYCTAILEDAKNNTPDYSNAIAQAQQTADSAKQRADEAYSAASNAQSTADSAQQRADEAYSAASNAQSTADSAQQRADEAYNYAMGIVVPPDNSWEVQQAQSRADEAYNEASNAAIAASDAQSTAYSAQQRADEAYNEASNAASAASSAQSTADEALVATQVTDPTTNSPGVAISDALRNVYNNLNDKIMQNDDGSDFALLLMSQVVRDFTADLSLIGDGKCISISSSERYNAIVEINDAFFNGAYLAFKSGGSIDEGNIILNYIYENTSRKVTLKFGGETLPTFKITNVAYPDYNLDIIIDDIHVRQMIESQLGVANVVALRMLEAPLTVGDNNDSCYWALVAEDGTVYNPGTY